jgi:hypothetical protein
LLNLCPGETTIIDLKSGTETLASVDSLIWIPKGVLWAYKNSKDFVTLYIEQRDGFQVEFADIVGVDVTSNI